MKLSRQKIQRMIDAGQVTVGGRRTGSGGGGGGGISASWVEDNYISKEFFLKLFNIHGLDENDDDILIEPNDTETDVDSIEALAGFWTEQYVSALGQNSEQGGGGVTLNAALASINNAPLGNPTGTHTALIWNGTTWIYETIGSGTNMSAVWSALAAATNEQINISHLTTALSGYIAQGTGITITTANNVATFALASGVVSDGTYKSVTVDTYGRVTAGTNPTTLSGYGITDAGISNGTITLGSDTITPVTSVAMTVPTGFSVTGTPISKTGTLALTYASGYEGFTTSLKEKIILLDSLFTREGSGTAADPYVIKANYGLYTNSFLSALGLNSGGGGGVTDLNEPLLGINRMNEAPSSSTQGLVWSSSQSKWVYVTLATQSWVTNNYLPKTGNDSSYVVLADGTVSKLKTVNGYSLFGEGNIDASGGGTGNYLPLAGGTMSGTIYRSYTSASDSPFFSIASYDQDIWLWRVSDSRYAVSSKYGYGLKYIGTGSSIYNSLVLYADNQTSETAVAAITILNDGNVSFALRPSANGNSLAYTSEIPTTLPASDVYAWAKSANKPSYTLDEVSDGTTRKLSNYLPLSGGTLTNSGWRSQLSIVRSGSNNDSVISFSNASGLLGCFGYRGSDKAPSVWLLNDGSGSKIWHESNDGSGSGLDADLLDGQHGSYYATASSLGDYVAKTGATMSGNLFVSKAAGSEPKIGVKQAGYGDVCLASGGNSKNRGLYNSDENLGWLCGWDKNNNGFFNGNATTATSASACTGNSATATKLAASVTLWGESFDGSGNISGDMTGVGTISSSVFTTSKASNAAYLIIESVYATTDYVGIKLNQSHRPLVLQNGSGNVGIGTATPAQKLDVNGNAKFAGYLTGVTNVDSLLYFDTTNSRVGVNTSSPSTSLHVKGRVTCEYDSTAFGSFCALRGDYLSYFGINSSGYLIFTTGQSGQSTSTVRMSFTPYTATEHYALISHNLRVAGGGNNTSFTDGGYVQIGAIKLAYDSTNNAIKVIKYDGSAANFYATGAVSALGANTSGGGSGVTLNEPLASINSAGMAAPSSSYYNSAIVYTSSGWTYSYASGLKVGSLESNRSITSNGSITASGSIGSPNGIFSARAAVGQNSINNSYTLYVNGNICSNYLVLGDNATVGTITCTTIKTLSSRGLSIQTSGNAPCYTNVAWSTSSDMRLKRVINNVSTDISSIANAPIFDFTWIGGNNISLGTSAQYWQDVFPHAVLGDPNNFLSMDYGGTALAAAVITARKVLDHEGRIRLLEVENEALRKEIEQLKKAA